MKGPPGASGPRGPAGPTGYSGEPGDAGDDGQDGAHGETVSQPSHVISCNQKKKSLFCVNGWGVISRIRMD